MLHAWHSPFANYHGVSAKDVEIESFLRLAGGKLTKMTAITLAIIGNALKAFPGVGELDALLQNLKDRCKKFIEPGYIPAASANPRPEQVIRIDEAGHEQPSERPSSLEINQLKTRLWKILEKEGNTLAALNAALFTSGLAGRIARKIVSARKAVAEKIMGN